jgi:hypothetical protein
MSARARFKRARTMVSTCGLRKRLFATGLAFSRLVVVLLVVFVVFVVFVFLATAAADGR